MENIQHQSSPSHDSIKLYKYRFVILLLVCLSSIPNLAMWDALYPLQSKLQDSYNVSFAIVNFCTVVIQNVSYIPGTFLSSYIFDEIGIKTGVVIGGIFTLLGLWIRCLSRISFYYIFLGHIIAGIGQPFAFNIPQKISSVWFGVNERVYATTVIYISFNLAFSLSSLLPQSFVTDSDDSTQIIQQIYNMFLFMATASTIIYIPCFMFLKSKPPTAPAKALCVEKQNYVQGIKTMFQRKNCLLFLLSVALNQAGSVSFDYVLQPLFQGFNFPYEIASDFYTIATFLTIPSSLIGAYLLTKTKKYRKTILIFSFLNSGYILGTLLALLTQNRLLVGLYYCLVRCLLGPLFPLILEFSVEIAFPVGEMTSGGIIAMAYEVISIFSSLIADKVLNTINQATSTLVFIFLAFICFTGAIIMIFVKEDLRRLKLDKEEGLILISESSENSYQQTSVTAAAG